MLAVHEERLSKQEEIDTYFTKIDNPDKWIKIMTGCKDYGTEKRWMVAGDWQSLPWHKSVCKVPKTWTNISEPPSIERELLLMHGFY